MASCAQGEEWCPTYFAKNKRELFLDCKENFFSLTFAIPLWYNGAMKIEKSYVITTKFNQFTLSEREIEDLYVILGKLLAKKTYELHPKEIRKILDE